jgi:hypothetical protein
VCRWVENDYHADAQIRSIKRVYLKRFAREHQGAFVVKNAKLTRGGAILPQLVAKKMSTSVENPVDLSGAKLTNLRGQLKTQLQPVLRAADYEAFDPERVIAALQETNRLHQ